MDAYANLGGKSGVTTYDIGDDSITVGFRDGSSYLYNYASAGQANIDQMKALALAGQGLGSFINRNVRKGYAAKLS